MAKQSSGVDTPLRDEEGESDTVITFRALRIILRGPTFYLQTLCDALLTIGTTLRGGAIISALHTLCYHGDHRASETMNFLLKYVMHDSSVCLIFIIYLHSNPFKNYDLNFF